MNTKFKTMIPLGQEDRLNSVNPYSQLSAISKFSALEQNGRLTDVHGIIFNSLKIKQ